MITIPNPCSENWSKMSKTEKGRFCNSCNKQVIDFSKMKNEKINAYFENNQTSDICGNFKTSQVSKIDNKKTRFKWMAVFVVFISFFANSYGQKKGEASSVPKKQNEQDSIKICKEQELLKKKEEALKKDRSTERTTLGKPAYIKPKRKR